MNDSNSKVLTADYLAEERDKIQNEWLKRAFYGFIERLFKPKTTFERYGLLMLVLQLVSLACSYISYVTGHAFLETYLSAWVDNPAAVFWAGLVLIVLLEAVKMLAALPLFLSIVRLQGFKWGAGLLVGLTFAFSMFISYEGGEDKVLKGAAPKLVAVAEISKYYDDQIKTKEAEKKKYLEGKEYQNSKGQVFHRVLKNHVAPLSAEITRLTALRDQKVSAAEVKNAGIESEHNEYISADAQTMAFIALGADGVKLVISFLLAWFFVSSAKDLEIIRNQESQSADHFGESAFGLLESMPVTKAAPNDSIKEASNDSTPAPRNIGFKIPPNDSKNYVESFELSTDSKVLTPSIVVKGFNKGAPMTKAQITKKLGNYKSRLKAIKNGSKKHGRPDTVQKNISKLQQALKEF